MGFTFLCKCQEQKGVPQYDTHVFQMRSSVFCIPYFTLCSFTADVPLMLLKIITLDRSQKLYLILFCSILSTEKSFKQNAQILTNSEFNITDYYFKCTADFEKFNFGLYFT